MLCLLNLAKFNQPQNLKSEVVNYRDAIEFIDKIGIDGKLIVENYPIQSVLYWKEGDTFPTKLMYLTATAFAVMELSPLAEPYYYTHIGTDIVVCHKLDMNKVEIHYCNPNHSD